MPAAEQELPNLLQRFEHEHSGSVIHLCMSKAMTNNRSVLAIPTNTSQEPKINIAGTHKFAFAPVRSAQPWDRSQTIHFEGGCSASEKIGDRP
jgi:hypothetical protein